jgi:ribosomal protein L11
MAFSVNRLRASKPRLNDRCDLFDCNAYHIYKVYIYIYSKINTFRIHVCHALYTINDHQNLKKKKNKRNKKNSSSESNAIEGHIAQNTSKHIAKQKQKNTNERSLEAAQL